MLQENPNNRCFLLALTVPYTIYQTAHLTPYHTISSQYPHAIKPPNTSHSISIPIHNQTTQLIPLHLNTHMESNHPTYPAPSQYPCTITGWRMLKTGLFRGTDSGVLPSLSGFRMIWRKWWPLAVWRNCMNCQVCLCVCVCVCGVVHLVRCSVM